MFTPHRFGITTDPLSGSPNRHFIYIFRGRIFRNMFSPSFYFNLPFETASYFTNHGLHEIVAHSLPQDMWDNSVLLPPTLPAEIPAPAQFSQMKMKKSLSSLIRLSPLLRQYHPTVHLPLPQRSSSFRSPDSNVRPRDNLDYCPVDSGCNLPVTNLPPVQHFGLAQQLWPTSRWIKFRRSSKESRFFSSIRQLSVLPPGATLLSPGFSQLMPPLASMKSKERASPLKIVTGNVLDISGTFKFPFGCPITSTETEERTITT